MALTVNAKTFTADKFSPDNIGYFGPAHTASVKDDIQLARVSAKPTTLFSGVARSSAKLTRTLTLTGSLTPTGEAIVQINISAPVGFAGADIDSMLNDLGSFLSSASGKLVAKNQQISF
jgi:hypothetical protein